MSIVNSSYTVDTNDQVGGGKYVWERHLDGAGVVYTIGPYLAAAGFDVDKNLALHAEELSAQLAQNEFTSVVF